jgi:hypothetical protein
VQFLSTCLLPGLETLWPVARLLVLGVLLLGILLLSWDWRARPDDRPRQVGLLLFLTAMLGLAVGVGWGRAGLGATAGHAGRYAVLAAPGLLAVYFLALLHGPPLLRRLASMALFALVCAGFSLQMMSGREQGRAFVGRVESFTHDLRRGMPAAFLARRYAGVICLREDRFLKYLPLLRQAGIEPFTALREDEPLEELSLGRPAIVHGMAWQDLTGDTLGKIAYLEYALDPSLPLAGLRLCAAAATPSGGPVGLRILWREYGSRREEEETILLPGDGSEATHLLWINAPVDRVRLSPQSHPCRLLLTDGVRVLFRQP